MRNETAVDTQTSRLLLRLVYTTPTRPPVRDDVLYGRDHPRNARERGLAGALRNLTMAERREFLQQLREAEQQRALETKPSLLALAGSFDQLQAVLGLCWTLRDWYEEKTRALIERADALSADWPPGRKRITGWPFRHPIEPTYEVERLRLESPLVAIVSLPPEFVAAGGGAALLTLLALAERLWTFRLRVSTKEEELKARRAAYIADRTDSELEVLDKYARLLRATAPADYRPVAGDIVEPNDEPAELLIPDPDDEDREADPPSA